MKALAALEIKSMRELRHRADDWMQWFRASDWHRGSVRQVCVSPAIGLLSGKAALAGKRALRSLAAAWGLTGLSLRLRLC